MSEGHAQQMPSPRRKLTISDIQRVVREYYGLQVGELTGHSRARAVSWPRQVAMALARRRTNLSLPQIGQRFGGRDHTTVIHALRAVEDRTRADCNHAADVLELDRRLSLELGAVFIRHQDAHGRPFSSVRRHR